MPGRLGLHPGKCSSWFAREEEVLGGRAGFPVALAKGRSKLDPAGHFSAASPRHHSHRSGHLSGVTSFFIIGFGSGAPRTERRPWAQRVADPPDRSFTEAGLGLGARARAKRCWFRRWRQGHGHGRGCVSAVAPSRGLAVLSAFGLHWRPGLGRGRRCWTRTDWRRRRGPR